METEKSGCNERLAAIRNEPEIQDFEVGRVTAEHKERYIVATNKGETEAEITGNLRFTAKNREDFPAVGDWVALMAYDSDLAIIHKILPRQSVIKRQAVGRSGEAQVIAANVDFAFVVQAVDRDFNLNRLERYLTVCHSSGVKPIIVLTKTDLTDEHHLAEIMTRIKKRITEIPVVPVSNKTENGYGELKKLIKAGKTYCLLGSSGVGKSTLLNNLAGKSTMKTGTISQSSNRGRHVTSHRELIVLDDGGIIIDNPGMREVGITDMAEGLETTFDNIINLSSDCKFKDCTHTGETGCAVTAALDKGEIEAAAYDNFLKMQKEKTHYESSLAEKRKRERTFGKIMKNYRKTRDNSK